jgi:Zn-dependent peptidase ImmA (M78 family)
MTHDYKVTYTREESIAKTAANWRQRHNSLHKHTFDITEFVETMLRTHPKGKSLKIQFYDRNFKQDDPAYVTFKPVVTLHIDRKIWNDAKSGDGYARFVIAHEIGHVVLHDHSAQAFSSDPSFQIRFAEDEHSAEWQANKFAEHFLLPDEIVEHFDDEELLIIFCEVPRILAQRRLAAVRAVRRTSAITGDACARCGNFTLVRNGDSIKCDTCGQKAKWR